MPKNQTTPEPPQTNIEFPTPEQEELDISTLETWLWDAACVIRGATDASKFKDFILPLIFYKRLSDVFDDEFSERVAEFGDEESARDIIEADHEDALKNERPPIVRFYIPEKYSWRKLRNHPADGSLGEFVTEAMREVARMNPLLRGVLDVRDFNEQQSGQRILDDDRLEALIEILSRHRLGLKDTEPDILGRAYEYLLRKFAEDGGQSAGEFYTPKEVGWLMARIINPEPYTTIYDPACGSGGLLIKPRLLFEGTHPDKESQAPKIYGQELTATTYAMAKMNAFLHDFIGAELHIGDTFRNPRLVAGDSTLQRFDYVLANPMWNQKEYDEAFYANDRWSRFGFGMPPSSSADWAWVQHMLASLNVNGRAAIVLDTGAVSRGSGNKHTNRERDVRKAFVEDDLIEGVILLPENLFYNTTAPGIILLLNRKKPSERKKQILLINLSKYFEKQTPKNTLTDEGIGAASEVYQAWESREKLSHIITLEDARNTDYNLSPSQFVDVGDKVEHRSVNEILADLTEARIAREEADKTSEELLTRLRIHEAGPHHLFSHGTKCEPRKDTSIGRIPRSWELVRLGDVTDIVMGQSPKGDSYNTNGEGIPLINGPAEFGSEFPTPVQWTSNPTKLCRVGDILFCVRGNTTGRINIADQCYCIGRGIAAIRGRVQESHTSFIKYVLKYQRLSLYRIAIGGGSTFPNITTVRLKNYAIGLPPLSEQHAIVHVLEVIDKITISLEQEAQHLDELLHAVLDELMSGQKSAVPLIDVDLPH